MQTIRVSGVLTSINTLLYGKESQRLTIIRNHLFVSYRRKMPLMFGVPSNAEAGTLEMRLF